MLARKLGSTGGAPKLYVDDVFSAYPRTGTGADVTVTTGIDMTKGYMLWSKGRSGATDHAVYDSARGVTYDLVTNSTAAQTTQSTGLKAVSSTGHTVGSLAKMNTSGATYVDFVFRKAPKFFDVVTYTGNGVTTGRVISHSLGQAPGMIVVKPTNFSSSWEVYHRSLTSASYRLQLETTTAQTNANGQKFWGNGTTGVNPTSTEFTVGEELNGNGNTYVAYLFAHDTSADGIIQCGSFTTDGSGNATVNLGWEPQYVLHKYTGASSDWFVCDASRPFTTDAATTAKLYANTSGAENLNSGVSTPTATGFKTGQIAVNAPVIYLAIRRPNKPPTTGTQVYNAIARTGTGAAATVTGVGFAPDLVITQNRSGLGQQRARWIDRLRGSLPRLYSYDTVAEDAVVTNAITAFNMDGVSMGADSEGYTNLSTYPYINHFFRRAPGFFDQVCYTGTGVARTVPHSLGAVPELMIVKCRNGTGHWYLYHSALGNTGFMFMNFDWAEETGAATIWNSATPSNSAFSVGAYFGVNGAAQTLVSYLFASLPGISKIGNYTGNGSSQTINCGFTTGARFILIKRTDSTGDWYVWDFARGIVSGNDPHLSLNTTAAEVTTDDSVDPESSGFIVNQVAATNINVTGGSYIFLAIA